MNLVTWDERILECSNVLDLTRADMWPDILGSGLKVSIFKLYALMGLLPFCNFLILSIKVTVSFFIIGSLWETVLIFIKGTVTAFLLCFFKDCFCFKYYLIRDWYFNYYIFPKEGYFFSWNTRIFYVFSWKQSFFKTIITASKPCANTMLDIA